MRRPFEARQQELDVIKSGLKAAIATVASAKHEYDRLTSEGAGISRQRETVRLVSPVAGLVTRRLINPARLPWPDRPWWRSSIQTISG